MDTTDTLSAILEADKAASHIYDEAARKRDALAETIGQKKKALARQYELDARRAAEEAKKTAHAECDAEIARMEADTRAGLEAARAAFAAHRQEYEDKVFAIVTGERDD